MDILDDSAKTWITLNDVQTNYGVVEVMDRSWLGKRKHFCFDCIDLQLIACLWQDSNSVLLHEGQHSLTFHLYCTTSTPLPAAGAGSRPAETSDMITVLWILALSFNTSWSRFVLGGIVGCGASVHKGADGCLKTL